MSLVAYEGSDDNISDSDEEQQMTEPAAASSITYGKRSLPREEDNKKKVRKIMMPKLSEHDQDDDEPVVPAVQATKTSLGGLFSILPPPKSAGLMKLPDSQTPKLDLPPSRPKMQLPTPNLTPHVDDMVTTSRPRQAQTSGLLLPLSVTRKPTQSSKATFSLDTGMPQSSLRGSRPVSKNGTTTTAITNSTQSQGAAAAAAVVQDNEGNHKEEEQVKFFSIPDDEDMSGDDDDEDEPEAADEAGVDRNQDQPLQFATKLDSWGTHQPAGYTAYSYEAGMEVDDVAGGSSYDDPGTSELLADEQFRRIQGRKNRDMEDVNIIDVRQDDQISDVDLLKNLTEETTTMSHSKKNKDLPTGQQKRKHQITYLAHKAKEQELELKNQWSQNRMTKKQTQAKYGF